MPNDPESMDSAAPQSPRLPRLDVARESRKETFRSSLDAVLYGPRPAKHSAPTSWFRDPDFRFPRPPSVFLISLVLNVFFFYFITSPLWSHFKRSGSQIELPQIELTWYGAPGDLPQLSPPGPRYLPSPKGMPGKPIPKRGADAFHPRQTIISEPLRVNHLHQRVIQPNPPSIAPADMPQLPNMVEWANATPVPPRPSLNVKSALRVIAPKHRVIQSTAAPDILNSQQKPADLSIAGVPDSNRVPLMPLPRATAAPVESHRRAVDAGTPPDIAAPSSDSARQIIALSATPAAAPPPPDIPAGNLSARLTISPDGKERGVPGGSPTGSSVDNGGTGGNTNSLGGSGGAKGTTQGLGGGGGSTSGPPDLSISGGNPSSNGGGGASGGGGTGGGLRPAHSRGLSLPLGRPGVYDAMGSPHSDSAEPRKIHGGLAPGVRPEEILGHKRIYTLYVNMPNLTSMNGSWVLDFAELAAPNPALVPQDLVSPIAIRKVDPKYPPSLREAHVEGEVVLYAIIREDGSVDDIQVLKSLDPQLDQNAIDALSRWKFQPALKNNTPIALESVVRIPFHSAS
jgi:TonB family protein